MSESLKVHVDHRVCVGSAMCVALAPDAFQLNDDRQSEVVRSDRSLEEEIREAEENCPVAAIIVGSG